jgi:hypothetical protein
MWPLDNRRGRMACCDFSLVTDLGSAGRLGGRAMEMPVTFTLLLVLGAVGVLDVGWYHLLSLRLYKDPRARSEQLAHLSRGLLYVAMLCLVLPVTPRGRWVDVGFALFAADAVNTVVDTWLERDSRPTGLPHGEYMVHVAGSVLVGATAVAFGFEAWPLRDHATALVTRTEPAALAWAGWVMVGLVTSVVLIEAGLHARWRWRWTGRAVPLAQEGGSP